MASTRKEAIKSPGASAAAWPPLWAALAAVAATAAVPKEPPTCWQARMMTVARDTSPSGSPRKAEVVMGTISMPMARPRTNKMRYNRMPAEFPRNRKGIVVITQARNPPVATTRPPWASVSFPAAVRVSSAPTPWGSSISAASRALDPRVRCQ